MSRPMAVWANSDFCVILLSLNGYVSIVRAHAKDCLEEAHELSHIVRPGTKMGLMFSACGEVQWYYYTPSSALTRHAA